MTAEAPLFDDSPVENAPIVPIVPDEALASLGRALPRSVYLGTSTWNFPGWRGIVYGLSSGTRGIAKQGLAAYSRYPIFRTVGVDRNFYRAMSADEFAALAEQVPDDFRFLVKAPRTSTDPYVRTDTGRACGVNPHFLSAELAERSFLGPVTAVLGDKAGPLVFQFSPFARGALRQPGVLPELAERFERFFEALQNANTAGRILAAEFRNCELLTPRMLLMLKRCGIRPVLGLHPLMPGVRRQIAALRFYETGERLLAAEAGARSAPPDAARAGEPTAADASAASGDWTFSGPVVIRWSLAAHRFYDSAKREWSPFNRIQASDPATRALLAGVLTRAVRSGVSSFMVANNKAEGSAPLTMRAVGELVEGMVERGRLERERLERMQAAQMALMGVDADR